MKQKQKEVCKQNALKFLRISNLIIVMKCFENSVTKIFQSLLVTNLTLFMIITQ